MGREGVEGRPVNPAEAGSRSVSGPSEVSLIELVNILLRRGRVVLTFALATFFIAALTAVLRPRTYTVTTTFMPQTGGVPQQGGGLLSQLGLGIGVAQRETPGFYADLVRSREVLVAAAENIYSFDWGGRSYTGNLIELLEIDEEDPLVARRKVVEVLEELITADPQSNGMVKVEVTTRWPPLSEAVAARLLELVDRFNVEQRQSRARMERQFAEARLEEARAELEEAERAIARFLERNRRFHSAPELVMEFERLQRQIEQRQKVYVTLLESFERARLDEVRDIPVITVVEPPEGYASPNARGTVRSAILGLIVGTVLGVFAAMALEFFKTAQRSDRPDVREFVALSSEAVARVRQGGTWVLNRVGVGASSGNRTDEVRN